MARQLKTQPNDSDVFEFLNKTVEGQKLDDCLQILKLMKEVTGKEPIMWGDSIIGFGSYQYTYKNGDQHDWLALGFSPRKQNITLYIMPGFTGDYQNAERKGDYEEIMANLGKYKTGKSCLYVKKLSDVNRDYLVRLVNLSLDYLKEVYPTDLG